MASLARRRILLLLVAVDLTVLPATVVAAFALRVGEPWPASALAHHWWVIPFLTFLRLPYLAWAGLYQPPAIPAGPALRLTAIAAVAIPSCVLAGVVVLTTPAGFPASFIVVEALLALLAITFCRVIVGECLQRTDFLRWGCENVAIYGAGQVGVQLADLMKAGSRHRPVAFLDDFPAKQGMRVAGLPVLTPSRLPRLQRRKGVRQVFLAMPTVSERRHEEIVKSLKAHGVEVKRVPDLYELVVNQAGIQDLQEVGSDHLLGRSAVAPDRELLEKEITGKVVMVTGAGGSIGSELCRQIVALRPARLVLFEQGEFALHQIQQELERRHPEASLAFVLGSVLEEGRIMQVIDQLGVETVYHAAAYKHVAMVENNPMEGVRNNVLGTWHCARAALACNVRTFVLISTDKAVRPTSVMGASKRAAELTCLALAAKAWRYGRATRTSIVRFGNVLGSTGSVVPIFRRQIARGGPVTVTHPEVERYFMTIPEAAQLVIQAGALDTDALGKRGQIHLLDMGKPVRILDLARRLIVLSNPHEQQTVEIRFTGLRPGEKLKEELLTDLSMAERTLHPKIFRAYEPAPDEKGVLELLEKLNDAVSAQAVEHALLILQELVPEFSPSREVADADGRFKALSGLWTPAPREASSAGGAPPASVPARVLELTAQPPAIPEPVASPAEAGELTITAA